MTIARPVRKQLLFQPGELAKVGQIWIIESLGADDSKTGKRLWEDLSDLCVAHPMDLGLAYCDASSGEDMVGYMGELRANIAATGRNAILHIECHGSEDATGLILADGSYIGWDELKPQLEAINIASGFNLVLVLGCCYGGYFGQTTRLQERAAFCAYLGPNRELSAGMLSDALGAFYKGLLVERDMTAAVNAMVAAVPDMPYFFSTAEGLFHLGFAAYIRDLATGQPLVDRAEALVQMARDAQAERIPTIEEMARAIKERERPEFDRLRRHYFAIDLFPGNDARFRLTYDDAVRAAEKPDPFDRDRLE
jgi:hypothetical protein